MNVFKVNSAEAPYVPFASVVNTINPWTSSVFAVDVVDIMR